MKTLGEIFQLSVKFLEEKKTPRARFAAQELLAHTLQMERMQIYIEFERPLEERELETFRSLLARKGRGEPLEYILGKVRFYGCEIEINPAVLIPRSESEILIDLVCQDIAQRENSTFQPHEAWDLCTGSGCLGLGLKKKRPDLHVSLSDLSAKALEVAKKNAEKNQLELSFYQGDLLTPFIGKKADIVLCNPPYISKKEYENLDPSVKNHEPMEALVGGERGTEFYERLSRELPSYLNPGARVYLEIGFDQGAKLQEIFSSDIWKRKTLKKDWAGHDRFFFLEIE